MRGKILHTRCHSRFCLSVAKTLAQYILKDSETIAKHFPFSVLIATFSFQPPPLPSAILLDPSIVKARDLDPADTTEWARQTAPTTRTWLSLLLCLHPIPKACHVTTTRLWVLLLSVHIVKSHTQSCHNVRVVRGWLTRFYLICVSGRMCTQS